MKFVPKSAQQEQDELLEEQMAGWTPPEAPLLKPSSVETEADGLAAEVLRRSRTRLMSEAQRAPTRDSSK